MNKKEAILRIQSRLIGSASEYLRRIGFKEILPPIIAKNTDPGLRGGRIATVDFYGDSYCLSSSINIQKFEAIKYLNNIFAISQVVRIEDPDTIDTGRHLSEFSIIEVEAANKTLTEIIDIGEDLIGHIITAIIKECSDELQHLQRDLKPVVGSFPRFRHIEVVELLRNMGLEVDEKKDIPLKSEEEFSKMQDGFVWITSYPNGSRGFYDRMNPDNKDYLLDFDLIMPEGYGEVISGGEREFTREGIERQMQITGIDPKEYESFLELYDDGSMLPSAGFGIGVERLTRYICGLDHISEASLFPKIPGGNTKDKS